MNLGLGFDEQAELYHQVRPRYPESIFDDLVALSGIPERARLLEIGAGTGIATGVLARRGYDIVALEPGARLAAVASQNLERFPNVSIESARFEDWRVPDERFDLIYSATAFHWIEPAVRYAKSARALEPDGCLAILEYQHVAGGDDEFFEAAQPCYERHVPGTRPWTSMPTWNDPPDLAEMERSGLFELVGLRQEREVVTYDTEQYFNLISTYSGTIALDVDARARLLECLATLMDRDFGGSVRKSYRFELIVARRIAG
ncbi:MAG: class I SAM-dependent methyltransferase [Chloroflexia bacterium]|nr:class I SAM-dependent methyltransferase [Chloroflexia bacterium]